MKHSKPAILTLFAVLLGLAGVSLVLTTERASAQGGGINLALGKPARQSSIGWNGQASRAVDGNTNGHFFNGNTVTHTQNTLNPWWEVDLQQTHAINRVHFFNRTDCCGERLNGAIVILYDANRREIRRYAIGRAQRVNPVHFGVWARHVRVQLPGGNRNHLSLAEVQVLGRQGKAPVKKPPAMGLVEHGIDRPGSDYKSFDLPSPDANRCMSACANEARCKAWTYVRPGIQGTKSRCWLKHSVPAPRKSDCCISGVRNPGNT